MEALYMWKGDKPLTQSLIPFIKWLPKKMEDILTIRRISICPVNKTKVAYLNEGVIGYNKYNNELGIGFEELIEIQSPKEGIEIFENIKFAELVN